jgi:hypothetical protein
MPNTVRRSHRETASKGKARRKSKNAEYEEENEEDPLEELTRPQLLEINRVFDTISGDLLKQQPTQHIPHDEPRLNSIQMQQQTQQGPDQGGGFIVEDQDAFEGGGFIVEEESKEEALEPGGFLADQEDDVHGGGFLPEESLEESINHIEPSSSENQYQPPSSRIVSNYISIRKIPDALKMLNLPYRNSEILDIFENAASSDEDEQARSFKGKEKLISRLKFSKVCAVLMAANEEGNDTESDENSETDQVNREKDQVEEDEDYTFDQSSSDQASSASDYHPEKHHDNTSSHHRPKRGKQMDQAQTSTSTKVVSKARPKRQQGKVKKPKRSSGEEDGDDEEEESAMQNSSALETFALFFKTASSDVR